MAAAPDQPFCPLGSLTKSSAITADFLVRVYSPKIVEYSYKGKSNGKLMEKVKFSSILLGEDAGHYCEASIKASTEEVAAALNKYKRGTAWKLSGVSLEGYNQQEFLHTSVRVVVDLKRTRCAPVLQGAKEEGSLALGPAPQITVAQVAAIKSRRCFDVMAVVHEISNTRTPVGHPPVADVCLVDGTMTNTTKTAEVVVAVWGADNITLCQNNVGEPLLFLNVAAKYANEKLELNLWTGCLVIADRPCDEMATLNTLRSCEAQLALWRRCPACLSVCKCWRLRARRLVVGAASPCSQWADCSEFLCII